MPMTTQNGSAGYEPRFQPGPAATADLIELGLLDREDPIDIRVGDQEKLHREDCLQVTSAAFAPLVSTLTAATLAARLDGRTRQLCPCLLGPFEVGPGARTEMCREAPPVALTPTQHEVVEWLTDAAKWIGPREYHSAAGPISHLGEIRWLQRICVRGYDAVSGTRVANRYAALANTERRLLGEPKVAQRRDLQRLGGLQAWFGITQAMAPPHMDTVAELLDGHDFGVSVSEVAAATGRDHVAELLARVEDVGMWLPVEESDWELLTYADSVVAPAPDGTVALARVRASALLGCGDAYAPTLICRDSGQAPEAVATAVSLTGPGMSLTEVLDAYLATG